MVNPCCCCGPAVGSRILALISCIVAIALLATSALVLRDTYNTREDSAYKAATGLANTVDKVGSFFGATTKIDADQRLRILLWTSATGVAVGGLQLLSSVLLLIGAAGKSAAPSGIYSFVNSVGFLAIVGSLICLFYQKIFTFDNLENEADEYKYWLAAMVADVVFLLYGICASVAFMRA